MAKQEVAKPIQWLESKINSVSKYFNQIKPMVSFQEQLKIYGINIYKIRKYSQNKK